MLLSVPKDFSLLLIGRKHYPSENTDPNNQVLSSGRNQRLRLKCPIDFSSESPFNSTVICYMAWKGEGGLHFKNSSQDSPWTHRTSCEILWTVANIYIKF